MKEVHNQIFKVDTNCIKDNQVLAMSVNRQDVERSTRVIRQYGLLMPPVVGNFSDGTQLVLSGECEIMALKEMGIKSVDAVTVPIVASDEGDKISLLLSCLKRNTNALSEAIFIAQLLKTGQYNQLQLAEMLGKSTSWINKRISLVTRLHPAVRELVTMKQLCPQSAQEISRLPQDVQYGFSTKILSDGLPKSAVEVLVAAFNKDDSPDALKNIILEQPRHALLKLDKLQQVKSIRNLEKNIPISNKLLRNDLLLLMRCIKDSEIHFGVLGKEELMPINSVIQATRSSVFRFLSLLDIVISSFNISLGKSKEGVS